MKTFAHTMLTSCAMKVLSNRLGAALLLSMGLLLSACGGGSSSSSTGNNAAVSTTTPVELAQSMRARTATGFDVQVTPYSMSNASTTVPVRVEIKVTDATVVTSHTALVGKDYETATPVTATPAATGVWSLNWPANLVADSGLLLSFSLKDGDVFETGLSDFQFK